MNTLTKLAINKKISAIFADGTKKMNLGVSTVVGLLNAPEPRKVPVVVSPNGRSSKLLRDLAESSGRNVVQDDQDGTLLVQPESSASPETTSVMNMLDKIEEPPVVEPEAVAWQDMTDEQRVEVIADDEVEVVEQIALVEQVAEVDEAVGVVEQVAEAFQQLAPKAKTTKAPKAPKAVKAPTVRKYATLGTIFFSGSPTGQLLSVYKTRESNPQKVADFKAALANGDCTWGDTPFSKMIVKKATELGIEIPENLVA
jgi:hypothetical protein